MKNSACPSRGTNKWMLLLALVCLGLGPGAKWTYGELPDQSLLTETVRISGAAIHTWPEGPVRVLVVVGASRIQQGDVILASAHSVIWFDEQQAKASGTARCLVYAEAGVTLVHEGKTDRYQQLLAEFGTAAGISVDGPLLTYHGRQATPLFNRANEVRISQKPGFTSAALVPPEVMPPSVSYQPEELEIFADNVDSWVEGDTRVVVATGHVYFRKFLRGKGIEKPTAPGGEPELGQTYELTAERVVLWIPITQKEKEGKVGKDVREVYAEGDVTLYRDEDMLRADQLFANITEDRALMAKAELRTADPTGTFPFIFRADEVRQLDQRRYVAKNGAVTTDPYGKAHFKFKGQVMRIVQGKRSTVASATNNTLQIGDVPVAYWPFLSKDLRDDSWLIKDISAGASSGFGAFLLTEWDLYDLGIYRNDWSEASLRIDTYMKRGVGLGGNFEYLSNQGFGFVQGYYIHDRGTTDRSDLTIERPDRGRLLWRHREFLPMDWRFDSEMAFLSDRGFLNEYFRTEYAETKPLETVQYFRKLKDNAGLTIGFQEKLNDFTTSQFQGDPTGTKSQGLTVGSYLESPLYDTTLQKFPEIGYHQTGQPLFNSLFTYNTDTRFDAVNLQYDSDLLRQFPDLPAPYFTPKVGNLYVPLQNPPTTARVDTRHDASMPFDIGPVRIEPMFSSRIQAESNSAHTNAGMIDNGDPLARLIAGPQVVATTNFWRIYDAHSKLLDVNHIKHIITPQFRYENSVIATESSDRFHNFDPYSTVERQADQLGNTRFVPVVPLPQSFNDFDRVESMDNMQRLVVELRQRLQTKRGRPGYEETVDLAELRLDYTVFPGDAGLNRDFKEVYGDFVRADAFWQLTKDIIVESRDNQVNTIAGEVELANIGVNFSFPPDWTLYVGQRYIRDARNVALSVLPGNIQSSNMTILGLEYTVSPKYAVTVVEQYDFTSHRNATTRVVVSRKLPGWVLDLTADVNPTDNDTAMTVQLTPMGLKQGMRRFW